MSTAAKILVVGGVLNLAAAFVLGHMQKEQLMAMVALLDQRLARVDLGDLGRGAAFHDVL